MISKSAEIKSNFKNEITFTNSAREGWKYVLNSLNPNSKILLPSYIGVTEREGSGIFDPVLKSGLKYDFYLLDSNLSICLEKLKTQVEKQKYNLILLVHYFGFRIENLDEIIKFCRKEELIIVEDCAHLFNYCSVNVSNVGVNCDYVFYSLHKFFPITKGGLLINNKPKKGKEELAYIEVNENYAKLIMSYDLQGIIQKRRDNFKLLESLIINVKQLKQYRMLGSNDIPQSFPVLVKNNLRERLYFWLLDLKIPVIALYYKLIPQLCIEEFDEMQIISNSILNLPIHQDINEKDIIDLVNGIIKFYENEE